jgi:catechol 2,3-dioxygenase-like lactoylglutathione lyase family enzyme
LSAGDAFDRRAFDHIGIRTTEEKDGAVWLENDGVWVTSPRAHPLNVEWVRYAPNSRMHPCLRDHEFHLAYRVPDLAEALRGRNLIVPPLDLGGGFATIAFVDVDGMIVELMQYTDPDEEGWVS